MLPDRGAGGDAATADWFKERHGTGAHAGLGLKLQIEKSGPQFLGGVTLWANDMDMCSALKIS